MDPPYGAIMVTKPNDIASQLWRSIIGTALFGRDNLSHHLFGLDFGCFKGVASYVALPAAMASCTEWGRAGVAVPSWVGSVANGLSSIRGTCSCAHH